jgi:hypothetical protein
MTWPIFRDSLQGMILLTGVLLAVGCAGPIRICSQVGRPPAAWSGYNVWDVRRGSTR